MLMWLPRISSPSIRFRQHDVPDIPTTWCTLILSLSTHAARQTDMSINHNASQYDRIDATKRLSHSSFPDFVCDDVRQVRRGRRRQQDSRVRFRILKQCVYRTHTRAGTNAAPVSARFLLLRWAHVSAWSRVNPEWQVWFEGGAARRTQKGLRVFALVRLRQMLRVLYVCRVFRGLCCEYLCVCVCVSCCCVFVYAFTKL